MSATIISTCYSRETVITGYSGQLGSPEHIYTSLNKQESIKNNILLTVNIIYFQWF